MIKFFRQIRQQLLMENKTSKYFKYAIGEIILVVIGILIALQINNWNENKKQIAYESKILTEIYRGLQSDSSRITTWIKPRIKTTLKASSELTKYIHLEQYPGDSIFRENFDDLNSQGYISINFGPYEVLKSNGLDKIKDGKLRFWLVDLFESLMPRQLSFIKQRKDKERSFIDKTRRGLRNLKTRHSKKWGYVVSSDLPKKSFFDKNLLELINSKRSIAATQNYRSDVLLEAISKTLSLLRDYFDKNDIDYSRTLLIDKVGVRAQLSDSVYVKSKDLK